MESNGEPTAGITAAAAARKRTKAKSDFIRKINEQMSRFTEKVPDAIALVILLELVNE